MTSNKYSNMMQIQWKFTVLIIYFTDIVAICRLSFARRLVSC